MAYLRFLLLLAIITLSCGIGTLQAVSKSVLVVAGEPAPAVGPGAAWQTFSHAYLDSAGNLAIHGVAATGGAAPQEVAVMAAPGADFQLVARTGDAAPVAQPASGPPITLKTLGAYGTAGGSVLFQATLAGPGVTTANDSVLLTGMPGRLSLVAREGSYAPLTTDRIAGIGTSARLDESGAVTFAVQSTNSPGTWLHYREERGERAYALGTSGHPKFVVASRSGYAVVSGEFPDPVKGKVEGIRRLHPSGATIVAEVGQAAPGLPEGWKFISDLRGNSCNDAGQIVFSGIVSDASYPNAQNSRAGLWLADGENPAELITLSGDSIPGAPMLMQGAAHHTVNAAGDIAFFAGYTLWLKRKGQPIQYVASPNMPTAPWMRGAELGLIRPEGLQLSANGNLLFSTSSGLWVFTSDNALYQVARMHETIRHRGASYTLNSATMLPSGAGGQEGRRRMLSDTGRIAFVADLLHPQKKTVHRAVLVASLPHGGEPGHAPNAQPDAVTFRSGPGAAVRIPVLANDSHPSGAAFALHSVSAPQFGKASVSGNVVTYIPDGRFTHEDRFLYSIRDSQGNFNTAEVTVRNPVRRLRGSYSTTVALGEREAGNINVTISPTGQVTGRLILPDRTVTLRGQVDDDGVFTQMLPADGGEPLTLSLELQWNTWGSFPELAGHLGNDSGTAYPLEKTAVFGQPAGLLAQRVTMQLRPSMFKPATDPGYRSIGYAVGALSKSGKLRLSGRLLDNRPFSVGASMKRDGGFVIHAEPYGRGGGSLHGAFTTSAWDTNYIHWRTSLSWTFAGGPDASFETLLDAEASTLRLDHKATVLYFYRTQTAAFSFGWNSISHSEHLSMHNLEAPTFFTANGSRFQWRINWRTGLVTGATPRARTKAS